MALGCLPREIIVSTQIRLLTSEKLRSLVQVDAPNRISWGEAGVVGAFLAREGPQDEKLRQCKKTWLVQCSGWLASSFIVRTGQPSSNCVKNIFLFLSNRGDFSVMVCRSPMEIERLLAINYL
jgi:hypothetical protein